MAGTLPLGDQDLLIAIVENTGQFSLFTSLAGLRSRTLDLLPAAPSAPASGCQIGLKCGWSGAYAFNDLFDTFASFPVMCIVDA